MSEIQALRKLEDQYKEQEVYWKRLVFRLQTWRDTAAGKMEGDMKRDVMSSQSISLVKSSPWLARPAHGWLQGTFVLCNVKAPLNVSISSFVVYSRCIGTGDVKQDMPRARVSLSEASTALEHDWFYQWIFMTGFIGINAVWYDFPVPSSG